MRRVLLLAAALVAGCGSGVIDESPELPTHAAEAQSARLGWRESYPATGRRLVFAVRSLTVTPDGWSADVSIANETGIAFELGRRPLDLAFGLMLFGDGRLETLRAAAQSGTLPALRAAATIEPPPPGALAPHQTWRATIAAPGSLADSAYVRVSFGTLVAVGTPPEGMQPRVVWITDESYRL